MESHEYENCGTEAARASILEEELFFDYPPWGKTREGIDGV